METFFVICMSSLMVMLTSLIFYEILRLTWNRLGTVHRFLRLRIMWVIIAIFAGNSIAVWLYALVYWLGLMVFPSLGEFTGILEHNFYDALYFSASTYSSLGYGDIVPTGPIRMMASIEVLNGLVMISWSASFTYLAMEKFWDLHRKQRP